MRRSWLIALGLALVGAIAIGLRDDLPGCGSFSSDEPLVTLVASVDTRCPRERPLLVSVQNRSARTVREVRYRLEIYERGDSRNHAESTQPPWTRIVKPGATVEKCTDLMLSDSLPRDAAVVTVLDVKPAFFAPGDTIPQ